MNWKNIKNRIFFIMVISVTLGILFPSATGLSQNFLRINEDIGSNSGTQSESSSTDNTTIYVLGGALVVGVVVYMLFIKKDKKENETDSTTALISNSGNILAENFNGINYEVEKTMDQFPLDLTVGIWNNSALLNDKTYLMGVSVRF